MKGYWERELSKYALSNVLALSLFMNILSFDTSFQLNIEIVSSIATSALMSAALFIFPYVIDCTVSDQLKKRIVFLWRHQPGARIFSDIKAGKIHDDRFTAKQVIARYSTIYSNLPLRKEERYIYENAEWYRIYHPIRKADMIADSHRDYLMLRDMHIATYTILLFYILFAIFNEVVEWNWTCILFELSMLLLTNIAARNKANRFVRNVIAFDMQQNVTRVDIFEQN